MIVSDGVCDAEMRSKVAAQDEEGRGECIHVMCGVDGWVKS